MIRLPRLARGERLGAGQVIDVQVVIQHPVRTGLERRGDAWTQVSDPFYLTEMAVFLGGDRMPVAQLAVALSSGGADGVDDDCSAHVFVTLQSVPVGLTDGSSLLTRPGRCQLAV